MEFERHELINLRSRAEKAASVSPSPNWQRAYLNLADALDYLDAMMARCDSHVDEDKLVID